MTRADPLFRSPSTNSWRLASRMMLLVVVVVVAARLVVTTLMLTSGDIEIAARELRRVPDSARALLWKDDGDVSIEFVTTRLSYWTYHKPNQDVDLELDAGEDHRDQYMTFEPDRGGFNNIRMQLEILVQIARATRRILVLPPSSEWNHLEGQSNLGDYYELAHTERYIRLISMDQYLEIVGAPIRTGTHTVQQIFEFLRDQPDSFAPKWDPGQEALVFQYDGVAERIPSAAEFLNGRRPIYYDGRLRLERNLHFRSDYENGYRLLATPCTFIYYPTLQWERYAHAMLRDGFHLRHDIFAAAASVIQQIVRQAGRYNAVHVRRNDFRLQYADKVVDWADLGRNLEKILDPDLPVYIATDEHVRSDPDFARFRSVFHNVLFLADFQLPDSIHKNLHGMVEQIICSSAERFIGTELSTYTAYIHRLRGYMATDVAPDKHIYYTTDHFTGYAFVDGWRTYRTWMKLSDHDVADDAGGYWQREYWLSWQLS